MSLYNTLVKIYVIIIKLYRGQIMRNIKLILKELQRVLESDSPKDEDIISIYDVADVVRSKNMDYKDTIEEYVINIGLDAKELDDGNITHIHGFDYDTNKLTIGFKYGICDWDKIVFLKDDERGLYIESSKLKCAKDFFAVAYKDISDLYDEFIKFKDLRTQSVHDKKSINSKFVYDINAATTTLNYTVVNNVKCNLFELYLKYLKNIFSGSISF